MEEQLNQEKQMREAAEISKRILESALEIATKRNAEMESQMMRERITHSSRATNKYSRPPPPPPPPPPQTPDWRLECKTRGPGTPKRGPPIQNRIHRSHRHCPAPSHGQNPSTQNLTTPRWSCWWAQTI